MLSTILTPRPLTGQESRLKLSASHYVDKAVAGAGYMTIELFANNELRYTFNNRLKPKNAGDTSQERNLECQARELDVRITRLKLELIDKKNQLSKIRKNNKTNVTKEVWDKIATLNLEIREIEETLSKHKSELFLTSDASPLGITHKLQESIKSPFSLLSDSVLNFTKFNFSLGLIAIKFLIDQLNTLLVKNDTGAKSVNGFDQLNKPTKFTKLARHRFLEYGQIIENLCGKNAYFITLTCPGEVDQVYRTLANYSSYIDNRIGQTIRDNRKIIPGDIFDLACWELHKSGKLHKHILIASPDTSLLGRKNLYSLAKKICVTWENVLDDMATDKPITRGSRKGCLPAVDMYQRDISQIKNGSKYDYVTSWKDYKNELHELGHFTNIQKVKKSVAGYLSKYVSKSEKAEKDKSKKIYFPSRWHNSCKALKDLAAAERVKVTISIDQEILSMLKTVLKTAEKNKSFKYWHKKHWDLYAQLDSNKSSKRINRQPWEPRPHNSIRVSSGCKMIMFFKKEKFTDIQEMIRVIAQVCESLNTRRGLYSGSRIGAITENKSVSIYEKYQQLKNYWQETINSTIQKFDCG